MSSKPFKRVHSPSFYKKKALDNILKVKEKFNFKYKNSDNKNNSNNKRTNYSTLSVGKTMLSNKNINKNEKKSLLINKSFLSNKNISNIKKPLYSSKSKSKISLRKNIDPYISLNMLSLSTGSNYKKYIENNNSNNIKLNNRNTNNISNYSSFNKNKEKIKYSYSQDNKIFKKLNNSDYKSKISLRNQNNSLNGIRTFNKKLTYRHLNILTKQYKYKIKMEKEEENKNDKICVLKDDFQVKNFNLNPNQVIDYLNLNEYNDFFRPSTARKTLHVFKKKYNFFNNKNIINKNMSMRKESRQEKINNIYPSIFNIEGQRNRKILNELNDEVKKNKKNDKPNCAYYKHHFNLQRRMFREKKKAEESAKSNPSEFAYKSQLLILSMKIYKRQILHLRKRNSFRYHWDLPSYNLFLNFS